MQLQNGLMRARKSEKRLMLLFAVLKTLSDATRKIKKHALLLLLLNAAQAVALVLTIQPSWDGAVSSTVVEYAYYARPSYWIIRRGHQFFQDVFLVLTAFTGLYISLLAYVTYCTKRHRFPIAWPVKATARICAWLSWCFFPSLCDVLLIPLNCVYVEVDSPILHEFARLADETVDCWEWPNSLISVAAAIMYFLHFGLHLMSVAVFVYDPNPRSTNICASPNFYGEAKVSFFFAILYPVLVAFGQRRFYQTAIALYCAGRILYTITDSQLSYRPWVTHLRSCVWSFITAVIFVHAASTVALRDRMGDYVALAAGSCGVVSVLGCITYSIWLTYTRDGRRYVSAAAAAAVYESARRKSTISVLADSKRVQVMTSSGFVPGAFSSHRMNSRLSAIGGAHHVSSEEEDTFRFHFEDPSQVELLARFMQISKQE